MRLFPFLLLPGLAACDVAGPGFHGAEKVVREVEGSTFTLRRKGDVVEAIRTSPEMLPRFRTVASRATLATQDATGCDVAWVVGDPAMMRLGLACDGRKPPPAPGRTRQLSCDIYASGAGGFDMECSE